MAEVTGGTPAPTQTGTEPSAAAKSATPESGANGSVKTEGLDARFAELTGENKRKTEQIDKLKAQIDELKESLKSEDEKRIDALAKERFGPQLSEAQTLREFLSTERDSIIAQIPEEHRSAVLVDDSIPIQKQITQARSVLALLQKGNAAPSFSGGGNPGSEPKRTYTKAEYDKWAGSVYSDRKFYEDNQKEMLTAAKDGRVQGLR